MKQNRIRTKKKLALLMTMLIVATVIIVPLAVADKNSQERITGKERNHITGDYSNKKEPLPPLSQIGTIADYATTVNFDDIVLPPNTHQQIINYAGITWDSGLPDYWGGTDGSWSVYNDNSYGTPSSPPNYVYNSYGAINPGFSFGSQVQFNGAYFMLVQSSGVNPTRLRFVGYIGSTPTYYSGWLTLTTTPTYLAANFPAVNRVVVEMDGSGWFGMDDVSYGSGIITSGNMVFVRGPDNALYYKTYDGTSWSSGFTRLGGALTSDPDATTLNGKTYVFVRGPDNALYYKSYDGTTWSSGFTRLGGALTSAPGTTVFNNKIYVFVRGPDNALYYKSYDGATWSSGFTRLGGALTSGPGTTAD